MCLKINLLEATLSPSFSFLPPTSEQDYNLFPNLENHSEIFSLADNVDNLVNANEQYAVTKRARSPTTMETSTHCPPAVVSNCHCEQSPTVVTTTSGPSTETPISQSMRLVTVVLL